jgi:ABC-2 type transport system permease protein
MKTNPKNPVEPAGSARHGAGVFGRYLGLYGELWRNSVVREMQFKTNFLLWIFVEMIWFALQLTFIGVLYLHTDTIGSWSKWQVVTLIGASHLIQQIFTALFLTNMMQISENIRTGRLDFMLLLPVNTRFLVSLRQVDLGGFVNAASAVAVMIYACARMHFSPTLPHVLAFILLVGVGILIHYSLMFMLASTSFWSVRAQGIVWGYYNLFNIARLPDEAFRGVFKAFFTFAIPMILVVNVPVRLLVSKLSHPWDIAPLLGMAVVCYLLSEWVWKISLRRYTSASS